MVRKIFMLLASIGILLLLNKYSLAQTVVDYGAVEDTTVTEPEQVVKLEELEISLEPMKFLLVPRTEAELPPIDFVGLYRSEFLPPAPELLNVDRADLHPLKAPLSKKIFDKDRK